MVDALLDVNTAATVEALLEKGDPMRGGVGGVGTEKSVSVSLMMRAVNRSNFLIVSASLALFAPDSAFVPLEGPTEEKLVLMMCFEICFKFCTK